MSDVLLGKPKSKVSPIVMIAPLAPRTVVTVALRNITVGTPEKLTTIARLKG